MTRLSAWTTPATRASSPGWAFPLNDDQVNGDEAPSGSYSDGDYNIVCNEPTQGNSDGGRTAMENCLSKGDEINVVYTINEPAAVGAYEALQAAGLESDVLIVSVDGGCAGVASVGEGVIGATAQQYPLEMAAQGVAAIKQLADGGDGPETTDGLDFFDTGVELVTDETVDGLDSIDVSAATEICWG